MTIGDFSKIARQTTTPDMVVGQRGEQNVTLREPLNPPSGWTKFKAALSSVPLLGQMGSLQRARQEVDSYPVKLGEYEVSNRQILSGFVKDLRENYGEHVAGMALRGMDVADGAPLSQRMVKTAMDNVEQAQKQQRAMNNMQITRFLESPLQGGARLRGEVDMTDICLERNMPLNGQPSWQQALGTEGAKFVSKLTEGLCRKLPEHSRQALTNEQIATAAHQALDTYQSLLATPGMTPAKLENLLMRANEKAGQGHEAVLSRARELAVTDRLDVQLNRKDPESLINSTATRVMDSIREENNGVLTPGLDLAPVLKSIANGISETVSFGMDGLPQELGCDKDTPSIAKALDAVLPGKIEAAIRGHVQALAMIQQSTTLTPSQKEELIAIAQTRRIDTVQVQKYEAVARTFNDATAALKAYAQGGGSPQAVFARLEATLSSFENEVGAMKEHGATMWEHGSLSGGDMTTVLMQQLADVAVRSLSPEDARALLPLLCGAEVGALVEVMQESSDMRMAGQLPIVLMTLLQAVATRAGETPQDAEALVKGTFKGSPTGLDLDGMRPGLALTLLTDPEKTDDHGVARNSPNAGLIAPDFDQRAILAGHRQGIRDYVNSDPIDDASGLPKTTLKDMGRATFCLNDQRIGGRGEPGKEVLARFQASFSNDQAPLARGVARCMNQLGINMFVEANNKAAYGADNLVGSAMGTGQTLHEAWPQEDGSWLVRSTHTQRPSVLMTPDGRAQEIQSTGLAVFSMTYRVRPGAEPGSDAVITVEDSQVAYSI